MVWFLIPDEERNVPDLGRSVLPVHRMRVYPAKNRCGQVIANGYLIACEEASNSDYQDDVFVISNVTPAPN